MNDKKSQKHLTINHISSSSSFIYVSIFPLTKGYWLLYQNHDDTPSFYFFLFEASFSFRPSLLLFFFTISLHVIFGLPFPLMSSTSRSCMLFSQVHLPSSTSDPSISNHFSLSLPQQFLSSRTFPWAHLYSFYQIF